MKIMKIITIITIIFYYITNLSSATINICDDYTHFDACQEQISDVIWQKAILRCVYYKNNTITVKDIDFEKQQVKQIKELYSKKVLYIKFISHNRLLIAKEHKVDILDLSLNNLRNILYDPSLNLFTPSELKGYSLVKRTSFVMVNYKKKCFYAFDYDINKKALHSFQKTKKCPSIISDGKNILLLEHISNKHHNILDIYGNPQFPMINVEQTIYDPFFITKENAKYLIWSESNLLRIHKFVEKKWEDISITTPQLHSSFKLNVHNNKSHIIISMSEAHHIYVFIFNQFPEEYSCFKIPFKAIMPQVIKIDNNIAYLAYLFENTTAKKKYKSHIYYFSEKREQSRYSWRIKTMDIQKYFLYKKGKN